MARQSTLKFEDRMFGGRRIAAALGNLNISQEKFLKEYNEAEVERQKPSQRAKELEAELQAARAEIAALRSGESLEEQAA